MYRLHYLRATFPKIDSEQLITAANLSFLGAFRKSQLIKNQAKPDRTAGCAQKGGLLPVRFYSRDQSMVKARIDLCSSRGIRRIAMSRNVSQQQQQTVELEKSKNLKPFLAKFYGSHFKRHVVLVVIGDCASHSPGLGSVRT